MCAHKFSLVPLFKISKSRTEVATFFIYFFYVVFTTIILVTHFLFLQSRAEQQDKTFTLLLVDNTLFRIKCSTIVVSRCIVIFISCAQLLILLSSAFNARIRKKGKRSELKLNDILYWRQACFFSFETKTR